MSATLPASFFQGKPLKEGARCEIEILGVDGDEVTVKYVPHEGAEEDDHPSFGSMVDSESEREQASY